ncbi:hypothetical protein DSO57_1025423 [Entomophthora muscae]|uniref:Uncharacterized protein n=1 Tax=Entomophthora muscae TaxID=34485 RepID=A0ACC2U0V1_9FUNG|nr:hypothetical protein DSO57_1025423 [Entomophthora muscae]
MSNNKLKKEAEAFQRVHPKEYLKKYLVKGIRPDGRDFLETRGLRITPASISTANGSSVVRIGKTIVVCGIKAEIAEPTYDDPDSGFLVPNVEMGPLCSSKIRPGPPSERPMVYSEVLAKILHKCQVFNKKSLCIEPGQAVWCLYIDVLCVSDDGNVIDAAILAMSNALKNISLPSAQFDEEAGLIKADREFMAPLDIKCDLFPLTFSIIEGGAILADPDTNEEELADGTLTLVMNGSEGTLAYMLKTGKASLSLDQLQSCLKVAQGHASVLKEAVSS